MINFLIAGGFMMIPLFVCSIVAVAIILERAWFFKKIKSSKSELMLQLIQEGKFLAALGLVEKNPTPVLKVLAAGISQRLTAPSKAMEVAGIEMLASMRRGLVALETIITISPFLGLLGTVLGMMKSFHIMATLEGFQQPIGVVGGVAEALITTVAGLSIALMSVIPFNYFNGRIEREKEEIEKFATLAEIAFSELNSANRDLQYPQEEEYKV